MYKRNNPKRLPCGTQLLTGYKSKNPRLTLIWKFAHQRSKIGWCELSGNSPEVKKNELAIKIKFRLN